MANKSNSANLGFGQKFWKAADELPSNMDVAEYKVSLLYSTDSFIY